MLSTLSNILIKSQVISWWQLTYSSVFFISPVLGWSPEVSCLKKPSDSTAETEDLQWWLLHLKIEPSKFAKWVENIVWKGEIPHYDQFLVFPQCFQMIYKADK